MNVMVICKVYYLGYQSVKGRRDSNSSDQPEHCHSANVQGNGGQNLLASNHSRLCYPGKMWIYLVVM